MTKNVKCWLLAVVALVTVPASATDILPAVRQSPVVPNQFLTGVGPNGVFSKRLPVSADIADGTGSGVVVRQNLPTFAQGLRVQGYGAEEHFYSDLGASTVLRHGGYRVRLGLNADNPTSTLAADHYPMVNTFFGTPLDMGWISRDSGTFYLGDTGIGYGALIQNKQVNGNNPLFRSAFGAAFGADCAYDAGASGLATCEPLYLEALRRAQYAHINGVEFAVANAYGPASALHPYFANWTDSTIGSLCGTANSTENLSFYIPQACMVITSAWRPGFQIGINFGAHGIANTNGLADYTTTAAFTTGSNFITVGSHSEFGQIQAGQYVSVPGLVATATVRGWNPTTRLLELDAAYLGSSGNQSVTFRNRMGSAVELATGSKGQAIVGRNYDGSLAYFIRGDFPTPSTAGNCLVFTQFGVAFVSCDGTDANRSLIATDGSYYVGANKIIGGRNTGWAVATGTTLKTPGATYTGQTISAFYTQAQIQALDDAVKKQSQLIGALINALHATGGHGLIGN